MHPCHGRRPPPARRPLVRVLRGVLAMKQRHRESTNPFLNAVVSMGLVAAFVIASWFLLSLFGVHFELISSLLISLALTAALTFGASAVRRMSR